MAKVKKHNHIISLSLQPKLVSAQDAARMLGISTKYIWQLDRTGKVPLPIQGFGGRRKLWSVRELDEWITKGCKPR